MHNKHMSFLSKISTQFPKCTLAFSLLITLISLLYAKTHLNFDTNQDHLISPKQEYFKKYKDFLNEFGDWEYIYVVINAKSDPKKAKLFSDALTEKLLQHPELFKEIVNKLDLSDLKKNFILLAPKQGFDAFTRFIQNHAAQLRLFLSIANSEEYLKFANRILEATTPHANLEKFWPIFKHSLLAPFYKEALDALQEQNLFSILSNRYFDPQGYLFSENGKLLFVRILPKKDYSQMEIIKGPLQSLRAELQGLKATYPDIEVGITGKPVLQNDEAVSTSADSQWAGLSAFILVGLLFFVFFKSYKRSLYSLLALIIGIAWTTGFVSLVFGSINLISIVFAIILIGLGIDYGIHFLVRYQHERLAGHDVIASIKTTTMTTGKAILFGAITTAIAFSTAVMTDFLGLQQLGIIAGVGIVLCCLSQLTVFPALLCLYDKQARHISFRVHPFTPLSFLTRKPKTVLILLILVTMMCLPFALQITFSNNLLKLQDQGLESVKWEQVIQENSDFSTWFLAYKTKSLEKLALLQTRINNLSSVKKTESILDLISEQQKERIQGLKRLSIDMQAPSAKNNTAFLSDSLAQLVRLKTKIDSFSKSAFSSGDVNAFEELYQFSEQLETLIQNLKTKNPQAKPEYEQKFMAYIKTFQNTLKNWLDPQQVTEEDIPLPLLNSYKGKNGYYSLTIYPKKNIWDPKNMTEFIQEVRTVIPDVTGAPVTTYESANRMISGFVLVGLLTSLLVILIIWTEFKSLKAALIIYSNLVLTFIWLAACMKIAGIKINLANFFALPILIGSGIDHGIHIMHRFFETKSIQEVFRSTVPAITLSCLTTLCGFASLSFVRHNGLASFGMIMAMGTFLILIASVLVLPNVIKLDWFFKNHTKRSQ